MEVPSALLINVAIALSVILLIGYVYSYVSGYRAWIQMELVEFHVYVFLSNLYEAILDSVKLCLNTSRSFVVGTPVSFYIDSSGKLLVEYGGNVFETQLPDKIGGISVEYETSNAYGKIIVVYVDYFPEESRLCVRISGG